MTQRADNQQKKVAIVTGATAGLGKAIAIRLAQEGVFVVATGRNQAAGAALIESIQSSGGQGAFVAADIEDAGQAMGLANHVVDAFGKVDILVASAGAPPAAQGVIGQVEPNAIADQVARTVRIKLNPVHAVVPHMTERGSGSILFVTSEGGRFPTPGQTTVAIHSGGLIMAAKVMAKELSRSQVRVNTLCVTLVEDTPVYERFAGGELTAIRQKVFDKIASQAPFGLAKPYEIASVATFLVSGAASHITGATLSATGGATYS
ncbi:hypothetical protein N234_09165 [Ralstonia pickettii DTP0602]|nr:hypothetical protein N234_09165 [Ralstonia pickettii DTP0602]